MSVQLIVYPQNYDGQSTAISNSPTEFLVNGINFNNLNSTPTYQSAVNPPYQDVFNNAPASIPNAWYRFRLNGVVAYPSVSAGSLVLNSLSGESFVGVYQRLTNLVVGQQYTITINLSAATTGFLVTQIADGNNIYDGVVHDTALTQSTSTFTADSTDSTIMLNYYNIVVDTANITSISIQPVIGAIPSGAIQLLGDGQVICDLYEDEDLPLTLSVDDFKNVAEKVQSYSKAFNLPSTKRNNRIFDHIFEITREFASAGVLLFNPYKRTKCVLKQDGFVLFEGYLRMLDITDKEGEISYNVNLYSEVVALADTLKDKAFRDLDFTELEHDYNFSNIRNTWVDNNIFINPSTSGFRSSSTVKYPFVDWNHNYSVTSGGMTKLLTLESSFRPFISIKYLVDKIFQASEFTYDSAFFNTTDFKKLYMDFNWGADNSPTTSNTIVNGFYDVSTATNFAPNGSFGNLHLTSNFSAVDYDSITNKITAPTDNVQYNIAYRYQIKRLISGSEISARWLLTRAATGLTEEIDLFPMQPSTNQDYTGILTPILQLNDTLEAQFSTNTTGGIVQDFSASAATAIVTIQRSILSVTTEVILQNLRGEIGQWDFLKGLLTMFNLITLPDENNPNNIKIEPYGDVFISTGTGTTLADRGIQHDWTDKIDISEMKLEPLADLNKKTMFKFVEDDDDYSFNEYKNLVGGHLYGSNEWDAGNEFNILEGEEEIIAEPFAATIVKPLMSQFPEFITPAIYARGGDATWEGFENSPRIMYNNGVVDMVSTTYSVPTQNGVSGDALEDQFLQFSHLTDIPTSSATPSTTIDFHFGICQVMPGVGTPTPNNLFNLYWLPYYSQLYNPNTRVMTIKVNLNASDINLFKFNDKIFLKNRIFRVNKIDYKPNDLSTVEFILIP